MVADIERPLCSKSLDPPLGSELRNLILVLLLNLYIAMSLHSKIQHILSSHIYRPRKETKYQEVIT